MADPLLYCRHCGEPIRVILLRARSGNDRDGTEPGQPQTFACPWCQQDNDGVFVGWLIEVERHRH
jgi:hypothetical protein